MPPFDMPAIRDLRDPSTLFDGCKDLFDVAAGHAHFLAASTATFCASVKATPCFT
ncbi:hypothetical protein [Acetobacter cerevisiae]|uniref:hypothetical protein n=1 Tax=Acetobacter cerevisiae TaxID=178900 RepID=UPI000A9CC0E9|nr:hypothetical protein [Acetobacter cerevisiae]